MVDRKSGGGKGQGVRHRAASLENVNRDEKKISKQITNSIPLQINNNMIRVKLRVRQPI